MPPWHLTGHGPPPSSPTQLLLRLPPDLLPLPLQVAPLWYLAQFTFNSSLSMTSVTSNTILSSTSALFTFLFAVGLLAEAFTLWKLAFILLLIVGEGAQQSHSRAGWAGWRAAAVAGGGDEHGLGAYPLLLAKVCVLVTSVCCCADSRPATPPLPPRHHHGDCGGWHV